MKKLLLAALFAAFVSPASAQNFLSIASSPTVGVYYQVASAMAAVLNKALPGTETTAEVTNGSVDNVKLVAGDPTYLGMASADVVADAINGTGAFSTKQPVQTLAALYRNKVHVVARTEAGIGSIADMKGKHISTGVPGSGIEVIALRLLEAAGLDKDTDVTRETIDPANSVAALKDGKIDAFFFVGGTPAALVADVAATPGLSVNLVPVADLLPALTAKYGDVYGADTIKGDTYAQMTADVAIISFWNILVANETMSEDQAYAITKAIFEGKPDMVAATAVANGINIANQLAKNSPAPFHPGAAKYATEQGTK
jgi:TRAP transporter TAXI family solute receptor